MSKDQSYQKFLEWVKNPISEFPESESKMPMITAFISPEEAEFLTGIPMTSRTLEDIAGIKEMDPADCEAKLKGFCEKGLIYQGIRGDSVRYRLLDPFQMFFRMPYWPGKEDEPLKSTVPHANRYYMDGLQDQNKPVRRKGLRSIPINTTLQDTKELLPFEDIPSVVEKFEYYTVSHCPCRMRHDLDPEYEKSPYPSEVCLHFDELGRHIVENGLGREITKEETLEILKKAADAGLVHGISNYEEKPDTICNCDPLHCTMFKPYHQLGHDKSMDQSNYQIKVTPETCKACGICARHCPMDAIQFKVSPKAKNKFCKAVEANTDLCIGCGVCVHKCPTDSLVLERRQEVTTPPKDVREYTRLMMADRAAAKEEAAKETRGK